MLICLLESESEREVVSNSLQTHGRAIFQAVVLEWGAISFSRGDLPDPGIKPGSPALQTDALSSEPSFNSSIPSSPSLSLEIYLLKKQSLAL